MENSYTPRVGATPVRETPPHCATCEHWTDTLNEIGMGECRRYFPALTGNPGDGTLRKSYPHTAATDFCSAHQNAADLL